MAKESTLKQESGGKSRLRHSCRLCSDWWLLTWVGGVTCTNTNVIWLAKRVHWVTCRQTNVDWLKEYIWLSLIDPKLERQLTFTNQVLGLESWVFKFVGFRWWLAGENNRFSSSQADFIDGLLFKMTRILWRVLWVLDLSSIFANVPSLICLYI